MNFYPFQFNSKNTFFHQTQIFHHGHKHQILNQSFSSFFTIYIKMNIIKALLLFALLFATTLSTIDVFTTSHVQIAHQNHRGQSIRPKQHFCSEGRIQKMKCQVQSSNACKPGNFVTEDPVCVFDKFGVKLQFKRECEACEHENTNYYFRTTCDKIPKICTKTEQCVNGVCVELLNSPEDSNRIICNEITDCPVKTDLCVANKCVDKRELIKKLSVAQKTNPELAEKNEKVKKQALKHQHQRRLKDIEGIKKLKAQIQELKKKNRNKNKSNNKNKNSSPFTLPGSSMIQN